VFSNFRVFFLFLVFTSFGQAARENVRCLVITVNYKRCPPTSQMEHLLFPPFFSYPTSSRILSLLSLKHDNPLSLKPLNTSTLRLASRSSKRTTTHTNNQHDAYSQRDTRLYGYKLMSALTMHSHASSTLSLPSPLPLSDFSPSFLSPPVLCRRPVFRLPFVEHSFFHSGDRDRGPVFRSTPLQSINRLIWYVLTAIIVLKIRFSGAYIQ